MPALAPGLQPYPPPQFRDTSPYPGNPSTPPYYSPSVPPGQHASFPPGAPGLPHPSAPPAGFPSEPWVSGASSGGSQWAQHPSLPPGGQGQEEVDAGLDRYREAEALSRGWVVVSPAPPGELFFEGAERYLPELLDEVRGLVKPEGDAFHLSGR